jgi:hypothetical protein
MCQRVSFPEFLTGFRLNLALRGRWWEGGIYTVPYLILVHIGQIFSSRGVLPCSLVCVLLRNPEREAKGPSWTISACE